LKLFCPPEADLRPSRGGSSTLWLPLPVLSRV
jgi:hypothetical protein